MALHVLLTLGPDPSPSGYGLALMLTYLAHGMVWCGAATLLARVRALSPATQSFVWLAALLGPLVTTSLASAASSSSRPTIVQAVELSSFTGGEGPGSAPGAPQRVSVLPAAESGGWQVHPAAPAQPVGHPVRGRMVLGLIAFCALAALLGCVRFSVSLWSLWRSLRERTPVSDARLLQRLEALRGRTAVASVQLSECGRLDVPLVLGASEICIPFGSLSLASHAEVDAVLAHELAHLERRDGLVFPLVGLVQALAWLQPLNHWLVPRFRQAAELACDDRAVELTGDRLELARALVRVASGASRARRAAALPAMARAHGGSALVERVRRLVAPEGRSSSRTQRWWSTAALLVVSVGTASSSVRAARTPPLRPPMAEVLSAPSATERIAELMRAEHALQAEIARSKQPDARRAGDSAARSLELEQQLRHVRETAAWIERSASAEPRL
jgi:beta-lactamase regulating signal transducer with metallopeptidase domain